MDADLPRKGHWRFTHWHCHCLSALSAHSRNFSGFTSVASIPARLLCWSSSLVIGGAVGESQLLASSPHVENNEVNDGLRITTIGANEHREQPTTGHQVMESNGSSHVRVGWLVVSQRMADHAH
eukprot:331489-Amphidinium_carterae.1